MRHSKMFCIPISTLKEMFLSHACLPSGSLIKDVFIIKEKDAVAFVTDHPTFEQVPDGTLLPEVRAELICQK